MTGSLSRVCPILLAVYSLMQRMVHGPLRMRRVLGLFLPGGSLHPAGIVLRQVRQPERVWEKSGNIAGDFSLPSLTVETPCF